MSRRHKWGRGFRGVGSRSSNFSYSSNPGSSTTVSHQESSTKQGSEGAQMRRGGHPGHLRGREIGLYYAKLNKGKTKKRECEHAPQVNMDERFWFLYIKQILEKLEATNYFQDTDGMTSSLSCLVDSVNSTTVGRILSTEGNVVCKLQKQEDRDTQLQMELQSKLEKQEYQRILKFRVALPSYKCRENILDAVLSNQVVTISGDTGCGKTTQIPQYILDDMIQKGNGSLCNIICTQPRRISAVSVAERVAAERCERVGSKSVGYMIRLECRAPSRSYGSITYCTTGVIFQFLKDDPYLSSYSHIILDEVHERETMSDILICVMRDLIRIRPEFKVILMSATLNAELFSSYFGDAPKFEIPGTLYPVTEYYLEDIVEQTKITLPSSPSTSSSSRSYGRNRLYFDRNYETRLKLYMKNSHMKKYSIPTINTLLHPESEEFSFKMDVCVALLKEILELDRGNGSVLIFVTGWDEISKLSNYISDCRGLSSCLVLPLHSMMPTINQRQIFEHPPPGRRKVIISTNIAETSITIDDIVYVINFGKIKLTNFDIKANIESLDSEWVSRANSTQRRGRAGRVKEGVCYHLYSRVRETTFEDFKKPEVMRRRLEDVILQLKILQLGDIRSLFKKLISTPSKEAVDLSFDRLKLLDALDDDERLTTLGYHLAHLPMNPHTGKMILMSALFSCVDPVFSIAASLSYKDPFYIPMGKEKVVDEVRRRFAGESKSDHWVIAEALWKYEESVCDGSDRSYCYRNFLSPSTCKLLVDFKGQFASHLVNMKFLASSDYKSPCANKNSENIALVSAIVCSGLYPNVATVKPRRRGPPKNYRIPPTLRTFEDGKVCIHPKSVNSDEQEFESLFLIYHTKQRSKAINLHDTTMVSPYAVIFFGGCLEFRVMEGFPLLLVDGKYKFRVTKETFDSIQALRLALRKVLGLRIENPNPVDWNAHTAEVDLLRAITHLITSEYLEIRGLDGEENVSSESD